MVKHTKSPWPVLTTYTGAHLRRVALPIGGIGTGTVSLGGRGDLRDWELCNRPGKGFVPPGDGRIGPFFVLYAKPKNGAAIAKALEGPLPPEDYEGASGATVMNHGLPRFRKCRFDAAYPLAVLHFSDATMPLDARLESFNPMIPADTEASSIPVAVMRYVLTNKTNKPVAATVVGMVPNFVGIDGSGAPGSGMKGNRNATRKAPGLHGVFMHSLELDKGAEQWGTMALSVLGMRDKDVTHRLDWAMRGWGETAMEFWDDLMEDGRLNDHATNAAAPKATLAASVTVPPRGQRAVTFLITWHFPNRMSWTPVVVAAKSDATTFGFTDFVRRAKVSDFFPLAAGGIGDVELPADRSPLNLRSIEFKQSPTPDFCQLHDVISARPRGVAEAFFIVSRLRCKEKMNVDALLGYDGPVKIWLDGREVFGDPSGTNPAEKDTTRIPLALEAGDHEIAIALGTNGGDAWGAFLRYQRTGLAAKASGRQGVVLPELIDQATLAVAAECCPPGGASGGGGSSGGECCPTPTGNPNWVGNHYTTKYADAWDVAVKVAPQLDDLEARTVEFVRAFCDTDLPDVVKEAALYNVSTLRTQTTFRTAGGDLLGWEGCNDHSGCCTGSCTHVWNYENAVGFLYGELARNARHIEFHHSTNDKGVMAFRTSLPIERAQAWLKAAADGQMGAIMRFYRDWKLSGDEKFLREHWPKVRKALEYCWVPGGWDPDQDGVMEGCQHNTMDVEYYGPNPQMSIWYLGALRAVEEMARHLCEGDFADHCRSLFERGRTWIDANLFNGEYYEHHIVPPPEGTTPAPETVVGMGAKDLTKLEFQLGPGCLVDQLVGQYQAHAMGLGYLTDPAKVATTLHSIMKYNFKQPFHDHFNHMRSYVLGDEGALLMATYPRGNRPFSAFPYYSEVMTGFEYTAAVGMLYEGQTAAGLKCIQAIRDRYDGLRRSPFDEAECGHHYARAMASWTAILALTGFHYSGVSGAMQFAAVKKPTTWFWSTGNAWGTVSLTPGKKSTRITINVLHGSLKLGRLILADRGEQMWPSPRTIKAGKSVTATIVG